MSGGFNTTYDTGKPDSGLEEWTSRIKALQSMVDEDAALERTQLELEIAKSREERAQRKSQSDCVNFAFQHATEVDSEGNRVHIPSYRPPPTSLAEFIGGHASGPRLNKHKPQENAHEPAAFGSGPYPGATSPLFQVARGMINERNTQGPVGGIRMPGMTSGAVLAGAQSNRNESFSSPLKPTEANVAPLSSPEIEVVQPNNPKMAPLPPTLSVRETKIPKTLTSLPRGLPSANVTPSNAFPLATVSQTPSPVSKLLSPSCSQDAPEKALTPSLLKLQGRGFVGERVKASDNMMQESAATGTSPAIEDDDETLQSSVFPVRKKTVLDRWPPAAGSPSEKSFTDLPSVSPRGLEFFNKSNSDPANHPLNDSDAIQERALSERTPVPPENASPNIEAMIPHGAMKSKLSNIGGTENSATPKNLQRPTKSNVEATEHIVDTWRNQSANVKCISPLADAVLLRSSDTAKNSTKTSVECGTVSEEANTTAVSPSSMRLDGRGVSLMGTAETLDGDQLAAPPMRVEVSQSDPSPEPIVFPSVKSMVEASNIKNSAVTVTLRNADTPSPPRGTSLTKRKSSIDTYRTTITLPPVQEPPTPPTMISRKGRTSSSETAESASVDAPLPPLDLRSILQSASAKSPLSFNSAYTPVSTNVLSIRGRDAIPVSSHTHIFYETELRAIVYQCKEPRSGGLASTVVWVWQGKDAVLGDQEEWKIRDLESRFCTKAICCYQGGEPYDLIGLLGGVVAIRHGTRTIWTNENMSMHCIREAGLGGGIIIDEIDLSVSNLCSAFSYVVVVRGKVYVWHGRGSLPTEQSQAISYAALISADSLPVTELNEGEEDSMFWTYLGDDRWTSAGFWSERRAMQRRAPSVWRVEFPKIHFIPFFGNRGFDHGTIYVVDGILELFVLVGREARSQRNGIRLALALAEGISSVTADQRPFEAPVHVVILPSQLPLDLRVGHTRFLDETVVNGGDCPTHLNLLQLRRAKAQLDRSTWTADQIQDTSFLPLGVAP